MGFSFRKSVKLGPMRLNLSKKGVGVSTGVKGARVSVGPRGTQLSVGGGGLYYRTKLGSSKSAARAPRPSYSVSTQQLSPEAAATLSVVPGLGHICQGRVGRGLAWLMGVVVGYLLLIIPGVILHILCAVDAYKGAVGTVAVPQQPALSAAAVPNQCVTCGVRIAKTPNFCPKCGTRVR